MSSSNPLFSTRAELEQAERYRQSKNYTKARDICERLLKAHPDYYGALHTAGLLYSDMGNLERSLACLSKANAYCPGRPGTLTALGTVYFELGSRDLAAQFVSEAARIDPSSPPVWQLLGEVQHDDREYEAALEAFKKALDIEPGWKEVKTGIALTLASLGRNAESAAALEDLLRVDERDLGVIAALAALPQSVRTVDLQPLISNVRRDPADAKFDDTLSFTKAQLLHQAGMFDEAWKTLKAVNSRVNIGLRGKPAQFREYEQASLDALRNSQPEVYNGDCEITSLFVLGPSRSGKTTVESILSMGDNVKCGFENPLALNAVRRTFRENAFISASQYSLLPRELESACREHYLSELTQRAGGKTIFTNTSPGRIHDINRIFGMLPNVRVLFVRRNERDNAFNIFRTQYRTGNYYSYDMANTLTHLKIYHEMMDLLARKYPARVAILDYETIVKDPRQVISAAEMLCGPIGFNNAKLEHIQNDVGISNAYGGHF